jgi:hypothetical protein
MAAPETALSDPKPRDRSIAARRAARVAKYERERLIVDHLNRGVSVAEIAERFGVTEKRMRALVKEILARRMPEAPEEFAAVQISRLNEALMVAYSAMSPGNLKAVALVVRIVRELDRYHGFVPASRRAPLRQQSWGRRAAAPVVGPEMAPEPVETIESVPENDALPTACEAAPAQAGTARSAVVDDVRADAPAAPRAGPQLAPQTSENIRSGPENGMPSAAEEQAERPSPTRGRMAGA